MLAMCGVGISLQSMSLSALSQNRQEERSIVRGVSFPDTFLRNLT